MTNEDRQILEKRLTNLKMYKKYFTRTIKGYKKLIDDGDSPECVKSHAHTKLRELYIMASTIKIDIEKLTILLS